VLLKATPVAAVALLLVSVIVRVEATPGATVAGEKLSEAESGPSTVTVAAAVGPAPASVPRTLYVNIPAEGKVTSPEAPVGAAGAPQSADQMYEVGAGLHVVCSLELPPTSTW
jgi:hypothetical protein